MYIIFYGTNSAVNLTLHNPVCNVLTNIAGIFLVTCFYRAHWLKRVSATLMIYVLCMATDMLVYAVIGSYAPNKDIGITLNIISYLLIFTVEVVLEKIVELKENQYILKKQMLATIGVPAFSLLIVVFMVSDKITTGRIIIITALGLLFINMLVFYLYDLILQEYSQKYKSMVLEREVSEYKHELSLLMESQRRIQGLKHDMRHHISALKNLSESGKHEELLQYLDNMTEFSKNKQGSVSTGNTAVDSILNYLIQKASDNEVAVETSLKIPDELSMEFFDLNVILGNLFDNAIDAAKETKDKRIKLDLEFSRNILYINLRNSCLGKDSIKLTAEGKLLTTKKEKETHGFGLQNVKLIIDKYSGAMKITHENHCFVVDCMLYLK